MLVADLIQTHDLARLDLPLFSQIHASLARSVTRSQDAHVEVDEFSRKPRNGSLEAG